MKVLVAGGSGLVGRCMIELLKQNGIDYASTYNSRPIENGYKINFENETEILNLLNTVMPDVVVNCIVQRQTDICEKNWNETKAINIEIVDKLSRACNTAGCHLVHISTDYVFDGKKQPHYPDTETNPLQNYGISKLISEKRVASNIKSHTIIRVPVLYCDNIENLEENAVSLIGKKVLNQIQKTSEDNYSIRRPVYIPDLCAFIFAKIQSKDTGIYHFYNPNDAMTKYEIAKSIAAFLGKSHSHIAPAGSLVNMANRPYDTELKDSSYNINHYNFMPLATGIKKCFLRFKHPAPFNSNCFLMLDLDGTLIDTDRVHFEAYKSALKEYNINLEWSLFETIINNSSIEDMFIKLGIPESDFDKLKELKYSNLLTQPVIQPIPGAEEFVETCLKNGVNMVVVTNTSRKVVEHFKECSPFLNKITNWVCREDYSKSKPNNECYKVAISKHYKNEEYKIGFENTLNGFNAIKDCVDCVYFVTDVSNINYSKIQKEDCYLINDYIHFQ